MTSHKVGVIGAGVIGLSSAVNILENIPNVEVTIIADKFSPNTTGDGAAGFWEPYTAGDTPEHLQREWGNATFRHLEALFKSEESSIAGVGLLSGWHLFLDKPQEDPHWSKTVYNYRRVSTEEISQLFPTAKYGAYFTSIIAECKMYLPWLMNRFKTKGGKVVCKRIGDMEELVGEFDVIVNCTGLHARSLIGDHSVQPIRGQLIRVLAPWIKHFAMLLTDKPDVYVIPGANNVVLGGTTDKGDWNTNPYEDIKKRLFEKSCELYPSLKNATIDHEWVGLRPGRPSVRLEKEVMTIKDNNIKVVHNYGHGGSGITFHWGCAQHATRLVGELLGHKVNFVNMPSSKL
ncbi:D-aspartate oxidase-like [Glandiceps talaboti]